MKVGDRVRVVKPEVPQSGWEVVAGFEGEEGVITAGASFYALFGQDDTGWNVSLDTLSEEWTFVPNELEVIS